MADLFKILLAEKLGHCDSLYESVIGKKLGGYSWLSDYETTPYLYRAMPNMSHYYNREIMEEVVGGSVGWNQLCGTSWRDAQTQNNVEYTPNADGTFTLNGTANANDYWSCAPRSDAGLVKEGHKYYLCEANHNGSPTTFGLGFANGNIVAYGNVGAIVTASANNQSIAYSYKSGAVMDNVTLKPQLTDLTLALGSTIADYVYSLEQATAGSGVAWLKEKMPKMFGQYNPYDAGSIQSVSGLVSHDTVGFNQWDEEWEVGGLTVSGGVPTVNDNAIRSKTFCKCVPSQQYCYTKPSATFGGIYWYDENKTFIQAEGFRSLAVNVCTAPTNARYFKVQVGDAQKAYTTYNHDICINLSDASRNGQYEPYRKSSYPLDSTLTLRGIPKLDNGKLYYDGDTYGADGSVSRKYGVVDLGSLDWSYESTYGTFLATSPTDAYSNRSIESASENPFICDKYIGVPYNDYRITDKSMTVNNLITGSARLIRIKDTAYSDATAFKTAMSGVYLVYELATPTTETAQPFTKTQLCDSGGTEEFVATGVNVWDEEWELGSINNTGQDDAYSGNIRCKGYISVLPNTNYFVVPENRVVSYWYDNNKNFISMSSASNTPITAPSNARYMRFRTTDIYGATYNHDISINYPSTDTAYHPYGCLVSVGHKSKYAEK